MHSDKMPEPVFAPASRRLAPVIFCQIRTCVIAAIEQPRD